MESVSSRFLRYVKFSTQSDEASESCPSTAGQRIMGAALVEEMLAMGIADAHMDEHGYIYGTVPGDPSLPTIGLIAHMDTAMDYPGENVCPRIVEYTGQDIALDAEGKDLLCATDFPALNNCLGKHIIVTDGTTLLGADDKAGIAEILTAAEALLRSDKPHATLKIGFTPDEEIGRGADRFDVQKFGADFAYTVDGGALGEIEFENFNAAGATVKFAGRNIHPGSAKDKMVNSQLIAMEFQSLLPAAQRPEHTEGYEGFFHLIAMEGSVENSTLRYIIRDHDMEKFKQKKEMMSNICHFLNEKYGKDTVHLEMSDSYFNMRGQIEPCMHIVHRAVDAMKRVGIEPKIVPIRGGTDGAKLSFMGLPCPNLCTGGQNFHGKFEYIPLEDMEKVVELLLAILEG
jgi:tripeptide aminopeptidase